MRAAVLEAAGQPPKVSDFDEPTRDVVQVSLAGLNPVDLALAIFCNCSSTASKPSRSDDAALLLGGDPFGPTGLCLPPQVLIGDNDSPTASEEVFGPVITVIQADGEQDALKLANDTEFGLSSAVFSRDVDRAVRFGRKIKAGMTHVNDSPVNDDANTAFGGEKGSGIGRFGGQWAIDEFTTNHWVSVQHHPREYAI